MENIKGIPHAHGSQVTILNLTQLGLGLTTGAGGGGEGD